LKTLQISLIEVNLFGTPRAPTILDVHEQMQTLPCVCSQVGEYEQLPPPFLGDKEIYGSERSRF